ncbi:MAG: hypothetical protein ABSH44_06120 [Bryobacteraceae bacterium]|jgi:hypothetical protein
MNEHQLLDFVNEARQAFGPKCMKLAGSLTVEVMRSALADLGIHVSARDVFIQGVPVELDILLPRPMATPKYGLVYEPSDVLAAFEVKNSGAFPGAVDSIRKSFRLIRSVNPRIYCAYVTLAERRNYKWAATRDNLGEDVYTLFWHNGSTKNRRYDSTEDWDKLTRRLLGNPRPPEARGAV